VDKQQFHEIERQYAVTQAKERLQDAANTLQRSMRELESYIERFDQASTERERSQIVNWAVNHLVCNITPNLRIDLLADSQAQLAGLAVLAIGGLGDDSV
jgi:DNA-binding transcriptional regulator YbjK